MAEQDISESTKELATDTLSGDVATFLIDRLRTQEAAFRYMDEEQQRTVIDDAKRAAHHLVSEVVSIIAADGRETIPVRVKKVVNDGDKIQVTIEAPTKDEHRHSLFDAAGFAAHLTIADSDKYMGGEGPAPDPDQPDMPGTNTEKAA